MVFHALSLTILLIGLLMATLWSLIIYYFKSTSTAVPILFLVMIIYVKYFWILAIKIENIRQELN